MEAHSELTSSMMRDISGIGFSVLEYGAWPLRLNFSEAGQATLC